VTSNSGLHGTDTKENSPRRTRRMEFDEPSNRLIGCAIKVHRELGPESSEPLYKQCF
jgi:hypothetical protein